MKAKKIPGTLVIKIMIMMMMCGGGRKSFLTARPQTDFYHIILHSMKYRASPAWLELYALMEMREQIM